MTKNPQRNTVLRTLRQRGVLALLAVAFLVSGILRLGGLDIATAATGAFEGAGSESADGQPMATGVDAVDAALMAIEGRAAELDAREAAIEDRRTRLEAAEALVNARLSELEEAEARLSGLLAIADQAAASDIDQLIAVYEAMGPDEGADLFAEMDPNFAAGFLSRMRPEFAAGILAELTPEQAYAISVVLATRNADVPRSSAAEAP